MRSTVASTPGVAFILRHGEAKVLLVDSEFAALRRSRRRATRASPLIVDIYDSGDPARLQ
jgi:fatty-acyl-CoA synthase